MSSDRAGYGHPPKSTRFRKGQSGNPKGRPKLSRNLGATLERAISQRMTVTENGRRRRATKLEIAVTQLVNKAASGDFNSIKELLKLVQFVVLPAQAGHSSRQATTESDLKLVETLRTRLLRSLQENAKQTDA